MGLFFVGGLPTPFWLPNEIQVHERHVSMLLTPLPQFGSYFNECANSAKRAGPDGWVDVSSV